MQNIRYAAFGRVAALAIAVGALTTANAAAPKYVFMFLGDGMSTPQRMIAEEYALATGHGPLTLNHLKMQSSARTCSSTSLITDSAAAATALACGVKTYNGAAGVDADGKSVENILEVAHRKGRKVGVVTSVTINHATPAGFCAHRKHRGLLYQIGLDLVNSPYEYFAGGGFDGKQNDKKDPQYRGDLLELAEKAGFAVATNLASFRAFKPGRRAFYRGDDGELQYAIDADGTQPTLAEMTAKGVELLDGPQGFFLFVEGGKLDHAGHANDTATNLREVLALDDAVRVAKEFQNKHPDETLILVVGDHETGGMAMGFGGAGYALHLRRLSRQRCSWEQFERKVKKAKSAARKEGRQFTFKDAQALLEKWFGFDFGKVGKDSGDAAAGGKFAKRRLNAGRDDEIWLTAADIKRLENSFRRNGLQFTAIHIMSAKAGVGWSSTAHTALPVMCTSEGVGADSFTGLLDNTDIAKRLKALFE